MCIVTIMFDEYMSMTMYTCIYVCAYVCVYLLVYVHGHSCMYTGLSRHTGLCAYCGADAAAGGHVIEYSIGNCTCMANVMRVFYEYIHIYVYIYI